MAKRRANGEGSIFKRSDGKWAAQYIDNAGKRKTLYGKTQQEVRQKLKEAIKQSDAGIVTDGNKITFAEWINEWLEVYSRPTVRTRTYAIYYSIIHSHIIPYFPAVTLKDISTAMLQRYFNEKAVSGRLDKRKDEETGQMVCKEGGIGTRELHKHRMIISTALWQAVENKLIISNPARTVKLPPIVEKEKEILTLEEQKRLEKVVLNNPTLSAFSIILALYTGMRIGELLALKIEDIDLEKGEICVRRTLSRTSIPGQKTVKTEINEPKTAKGKRIIPIPDFLVELIERYINTRNQIVEATNGYWAGRTHEEARLWKDEGFMFVATSGRIPDPTGVSMLFHRMLDKAGVKRVTFHALRHTFATRCIEHGFDIKSLSEILGHKDAATTLNTYTHALEEQKRNNMEKLKALYEMEPEKDEDEDKDK